MEWVNQILDAYVNKLYISQNEIFKFIMILYILGVIGTIAQIKKGKSDVLVLFIWGIVAIVTAIGHVLSKKILIPFIENVYDKLGDNKFLILIVIIGIAFAFAFILAIFSRNGLGFLILILGENIINGVFVIFTGILAVILLCGELLVFVKNKVLFLWKKKWNL